MTAKANGTIIDETNMHRCQADGRMLKLPKRTDISNTAAMLVRISGVQVLVAAATVKSNS